ncbi:MAG: hypothetical protein ABIJ95_00765, partial [Pseudomonadota bacterium]
MIQVEAGESREAGTGQGREWPYIWACHVGILLVYFKYFFKDFLSQAGTLGHDYCIWFPQFLDGYRWFSINGLFKVPWFTPSFCGGVPYFPNHQGLYYSIPQFLTFVSSPLTAIILSIMFFAALGYAGMYVLARKGLGAGPRLAMFTAAIFLFNGYYYARMEIGHLSMQPFMLLPWLAFLLARPPGNRPRGRFVFDAVAAGLILSYMIYAGVASSFLQMLFSVFAVVLFFLIRGGLNPVYAVARGAAAVGVFAGVSGAKILSSMLFLKNFPRDIYSTPGVDSLCQSLALAVKSVFFSSAHAYGQEVMKNSQWIIEPHEYSYSLTFLPLLVFAAALAWWIREKGPRRMGRPNPWKAAGWVLLSGVLFLPVLLNWNYEPLHVLLKKLPILKSTSLYLRWELLYILPVPVFMAAATRRIRVPTAAAWALCIAGLVALSALNLAGDRSFYANQAYPIRAVQGAFLRQKGQPPPAISDIAAIQNARGEIVTPLDRDDVMIQGYSQLFCYEAIFGYGLEAFPFRTLRPGPVTGESEGVFNMKNPACYVFPEANQCQP